VIWSMRETKLRGYAVDEPVLAELTHWVADTAYGTTAEARPVGEPKRLSAGSAWFALGIEADPKLFTIKVNRRQEKKN